MNQETYLKRCLLFVAAVLLLAVGGAVTAQTNAAYAKSLQDKYASRLIFKTPKARAIVNAFNIGCRRSDGRFVPLIRILYARMARTTAEKAWTVTYVDSRNQEVRIYDVVVNKAGEMSRPILALAINQWGELHTFCGIRAEGVLNTCFGIYGPIWITPENRASSLYGTTR